jgi:SAM-dependent methyltransferase
VADLASIPCRACGAEAADAEPRYARVQDAGPPLGRFETRLVQCRGCGFVQVSPRPTPAALARHYAEAGSASGAVFRETGAGSRHAALAARRVRFVRGALAGLGASGALLEVGCGRGDLLRELAPAGWRAVGLEPSPSAAAHARAAGPAVVEETLERTTALSEAFDAVVAFSVLEHLDDPGAAADRLAALCGPGGRIVVEVPDTRRPFEGVAEFFAFEHLSHFTPHTLARLFAARGFGLIALERDAEHSGIAAAFHRGPAVVETQDDRDDAARAIADYAARRAELEHTLAERLAARIAEWRTAGARVGVYGAGVHTRFLFDLAPLREAAVALLDGDPAKRGCRILGLPVHAPEDAGALELDAVVLSSRAFEDEMAARLAPFAAAGGEVVRLYR